MVNPAVTCRAGRGRNESEATVSTGVYLYRLQAGESMQVLKMILLK